jgi:hypothetical protein
MMLQDKSGFLSQQDVVLPSQYWETLKRQDRLEPEKKLMLAVLENAIWTYTKHFGRRNLYFCEVAHWFREGSSDQLYAFENICEFLGLSAQCIRRALLKNRTREEAGELHRRLGRKVKNTRRQRAFESNVWSPVPAHAMKQRSESRFPIVRNLPRRLQSRLIDRSGETKAL